MAKGFQRRNSVSTGTPFSEVDLATILRLERDEGLPDLLFCFTRGMPGHPPDVFSWEWLLDLTIGINSFNGKHKTPPVHWPSFPHTAADIERVIAWRKRSPAG